MREEKKQHAGHTPYLERITHSLLPYLSLLRHTRGFNSKNFNLALAEKLSPVVAYRRLTPVLKVYMSFLVLILV